ncbi:hypothetical protein KZZ20_09765, partial [Methylacidiphilum fumariolicum]
VVVYGKEWTGTDPCVEREALAGWNLAAGWKSASRAYSGETARREARNSIPEPSGLDGVVHLIRKAFALLRKILHESPQAIIGAIRKKNEIGSHIY